jgi:hypothetical protein
MNERRNEAKRRQEIIINVPSKPTSGNILDAYLAHYQDVMRLNEIQGKSKDSIDASRMDAMISIRLRSTGHPKEDIKEAIEAMAPEIRKDLGSKGAHPWPEYAERTAKYTFSARGDIEVSKRAQYIKNWQSVERNAARAAGKEQSRNNFAR